MAYFFNRSSLPSLPYRAHASLLALLLSLSSLSAPAQEKTPTEETKGDTTVAAPAAPTDSAKQADAVEANANAPAVEAHSDAPASNAPTSDAPTSDAPASDAPTSDLPASDAPASLPSPTEADKKQEQDDQEWIKEYLHLKSLMLEGRFDEARRGFKDLFERTSDPIKQRLAVEMSFLAQGYLDRGITVVSKAELDESELGAKTSGKRSTYEIALLYLNSVVYGVGSGTWVAALSQTDNTAGIILPMMGFSLLSAGAIYWADRHDRFRYGVPHSIVTGMYLGTTQGILWAAQIGRNNWLSAGATASMIWGGASVGALTGGLLGHNLGTTPGRSSWVGSTALWTGAVSGLTVGAATSGGAAFAGAAIGHGVGIVGGLLTAGTVAPSVGRVVFIDLGAIAGGLTGAGIYAAAAGDSFNGHAMAGVSAGSIAAGAVASYLLTESMAKDLLPDEENSLVASLRPNFSTLEGGAYVSLSGRW